MNPELEKLIDTVAQGGVVTNLIRQTLRRKAQSLGEDPDLVEILLEQRLARQAGPPPSVVPMNSAPPPPPVRVEAPVPAPKPEREKQSSCGGCGAALSGQFVCEFCGTPTGLQATTEAEELKMLAELSTAARQLSSNVGGGGGLWSGLMDFAKIELQMTQFWKNAPLPKSPVALIQAARDALASFTGLKAGNSLAESEATKLARAEMIISLLKGNPKVPPYELEALQEAYSKKVSIGNKIEAENNRLLIGFGIFLVSLFLIVILSVIFGHKT